MKTELTLVRRSPMTGEQPAAIFPRDGSVWMSAMAPVLDPDDMQWSLTVDGSHVRVPLVPYRIRANFYQGFGFGIELGVRAMHRLPPQVNPQAIKTLKILVDESSEQLNEEGVETVRLYAGLALRL